MDGPEVIMDAEEYLQPKCRAPLPSTSTVETPLPPATPVKKFANGQHGETGTLPLGAYGAEAFAGHASSAAPSRFSNGHHPYHPGQMPAQFGTLPCQQQHGSRDSGGLRYCSDPLQLVKGVFFLIVPC